MTDKEQLEQPDQEPVAYVSSWKDEKGYVMQGYNREISTCLMSGTALYLAPQKTEWVELANEDIYAIGKHLGKACRLGGNPHIDIDYARAIEAKLKELNT